MSPAASSTPSYGDLPPGEAEHVRGDVVCATCRYSLRGLPVSGNCPECGAPVYQSLSRGLRDCHPAVLLPMLSGLRRLFIAICITPPAISVAVLLAVAGARLELENATAWGYAGVAGIGLWPWLIGWFQLALAGDPYTGRSSPRYVALRVLVVLTPLLLVTSMLTTPASGGSRLFTTSLLLLLEVLLFVYVVGTCVLVRIARAVGDDDVERNADVLRAVAVLIAGVLQVVVVLFVADHSGGMLFLIPVLFLAPFPAIGTLIVIRGLHQFVSTEQRDRAAGRL